MKTNKEEAYLTCYWCFLKRRWFDVFYTRLYWKHTYFSSYYTVAIIETTSKPLSGAFVHFPSYISFSSLSLPSYSFSIVGCCLAVQSFKKGKLIVMFLLSFSFTHTFSLSLNLFFCRVFLHSVSLFLFCWTLKCKGTLLLLADLSARLSTSDLFPLKKFDNDAQMHACVYSD